MALRRSVAILFIALTTACTRTILDGPLIDAYSKAECIPVEADLGHQESTRRWDYTIKTAQGGVRLFGAQMPGGRINASYAANREDVVAADAGDYIYPEDVRVDHSLGRVYIKASGVPVFGESETWLFGYDVAKKRQLQRARVDPKVLPQDCPADSSKR